MRTMLLGFGAAFMLHTSLGVAQNLLTTLPDWNDESIAYQSNSRNLNVSPGWFEHIEGGNYSEERLGWFGDACCFSNTEMHEDTEGDDLWTAYHMWKRLDGIKPTTAWRARVESLKNYYINDYPALLAGSGRETDNNYDHVYGWGLCDWYKTEGAKEPDGGAKAISAINNIVFAMEQWSNSFQGGIEPGASILGNSNGSRRWARQLRIAVCAAEVSPTQSNINWRNRVIDIVMQTPDFNDVQKMYFYSSAETARKGFNAAAGERVINTFHMGIWMEAMWQAWRELNSEGDPRASAVKQRLIDMATYYRDKAPEPDDRIPLLTGLNIDTGQVINTSSTGYGNTSVYSISPINGLVFGYKLTGNQSYLDAAWALWLRFQESESGQQNTIVHFADSQLSSANGFRLLRHNKGELQYIYALFENGGNPSLIGTGPIDSIAPSAPTELRVN